MSATSSNDRPSVDSQPSIDSSPTLFSRTLDNHGGSRQVSSGSRSNSAMVREGGRHLEDGIQEQDFARRKQRVRRSGGFLLDSNFTSSSQSRYSYHSKSHLDPTSKHRLLHDGAKNRDEQRDAYVDPQNQKAQIRVGKTRRSAKANMSQPQAIDPTQLVNMALNLSEGRRRNLHAGQLMSTPPRVTSITQREGSYSAYGADSSLRQYLNEPRKMSRNISPMGGTSSPSRHLSSSIQRNTSFSTPGTQTFHPSMATMARIRKAQAYIELRMEYLRLLEFLPLLKPDAEAPGNFVITSNNVPGSPTAQLTRMPSFANKQHGLGRPYNPLQYIRNRKTRARERQVLAHPAADFANVLEVRDWVDRVEEHAKLPGYRRHDEVRLPQLHLDTGSHDIDSVAKLLKGWAFSPEELLADAYWLEQDANKLLIENRYGRKVFPPKLQSKQDFLQSRASKEYPETQRQNWNDQPPRLSIDLATGDESENPDVRGRRRKLLPALRTESLKPSKHQRHGSHFRMKDDSISSDSDAGLTRRRTRIARATENNTGPLARLLDQHAKEASSKPPAFILPGTSKKLDNEFDIVERREARDSLEVPRLGDAFAYVKDRDSEKRPLRIRTDPLSVDGSEPRSSFDDIDSTAPNTPLRSKPFPRIGDEFSPPSSRAASGTRKSKRSKLHLFHSHEPSEVNKHGFVSESDGKERQYMRQTSGETSDDKHVMAAFPGAVRNFLGHRKNASVNSLPSSDRLRRKDTQEPQSAVTRFFKGVKYEGTKVGDYIFRKDRIDGSDVETTSSRNSMDFDTDLSAKSGYSKRPQISQATTDTTIAGSSSNNPGFSRFELPTFRSINQNNADSHASDNEDHITRQNRDRKKDRSQRFDHLAPPRMNLSTLSENSSMVSLTSTNTQSDDRINKQLAHPGGANPIGLPPTALRKPRGSDVIDGPRPTRPNLKGKRHWSMTEEGRHFLRTNSHHITQADVARVRAIFLCSGIKARQLCHQAYKPRLSDPPKFLARAAATAEHKLYPVSRKEEHVLAARFLVKDLEFSTKSLRTSLHEFRDSVVKELTTQICHLQSRVDSDLMPRILDGGDKAICVTSEISGHGPLQVKEITDEIDRMMRARRRRTRWVRRLGWGLVEWGVVTFMWWLWLVVMLLRLVKNIFGLAWAIVRWFLWI